MISLAAPKIHPTIMKKETAKLISKVVLLVLLFTQLGCSESTRLHLDKSTLGSSLWQNI